MLSHSSYRQKWKLQPCQKVSEFNKEMPQSHTVDQSNEIVSKRQATPTATQQQEHNESKVIWPTISLKDCNTWKYTKHRIIKQGWNTQNKDNGANNNQLNNSNLKQIYHLRMDSSQSERPIIFKKSRWNTNKQTAPYLFPYLTTFIFFDNSVLLCNSLCPF